MESIIDADLSSQLQVAVDRLEAEERKISTVRSLLQAAQSQLGRKNEKIRELTKNLRVLKARKEDKENATATGLFHD